MPAGSDDRVHEAVWHAMVGAALRVVFGLIWVVDAALAWTPQFAANYVGYLHNAAQGQPGWSAWWFTMWIAIVTPHASLFIWLTRLAETLLALALLVGFARKSVYIAGALFSLLIWSTAEGFGGPYAVGATNMGAAIAYVLLFVALSTINYRAGVSPYSLDYLIERRWPGWRRVAEWGDSTSIQSIHPAPWRVQATVLGSVAALVFFIVGGLYSSIHGQAPSPASAAAAVTPLSLAASTPIAKARDAELPPLQPGPSIAVNLTVTDQKVEIASGVYYNAWTYNGGAPGPVIHVRQGQTVNVTLTNNGTMPHSIDFHAAQIAPDKYFVDVDPGKSIHFSFVASVPGAFVYHCETAPILLHMGNGMYGAIIVSPETPLPPAAKSYVLVQSEWYTRQIVGTLMGADYQKMQQRLPDEVVFNGAAFQYVNHPLPAVAGERIRIYLVDAGPNLWTAFHVIGAVFDKVYPDGDPTQVLTDVSTYSVGPGEGAVFDLVIKNPGKYSFVDHGLANLMIGAHGVLDVRTPGTPVPATSSKASFFTPTIANTSTRPVAAKQPTGPYHFDPTQGATLYTANCSACHQETGSGMPGAFPPLKGNAAVLDANPNKQINVVLHGLHGESIGGVTYQGLMPPFGESLTDQQIADIINHERSSWGNQSKPISPDQVKALRTAGNK